MIRSRVFLQNILRQGLRSVPKQTLQPRQVQFDVRQPFAKPLRLCSTASATTEASGKPVESHEFQAETKKLLDIGKYNLFPNHLNLIALRNDETYQTHKIQMDSNRTSESYYHHFSTLAFLLHC